MAEPRGPSAGDPTGSGPDHPPAGAPLWVKVFGIAVIVAVVLLIILLIAGGGHGPGRHF